MKIVTLKDIRDSLKDVPDELLGGLYFGFGEGAEDRVSMLASEGSGQYEFPQVFDLIDKKYPQLDDLNHLIKNIAKVQSVVDNDGKDAEKLSEKYFEEQITSEDFPEDRPKSSSFSKINTNTKD